MCGCSDDGNCRFTRVRRWPTRGVPGEVRVVRRFTSVQDPTRMLLQIAMDSVQQVPSDPLPSGLQDFKGCSVQDHTGWSRLPRSVTFRIESFVLPRLKASHRCVAASARVLSFHWAQLATPSACQRAPDLRPRHRPETFLSPTSPCPPVFFHPTAVDARHPLGHASPPQLPASPLPPSPTLPAQSHPAPSAAPVPAPRIPVHSEPARPARWTSPPSPPTPPWCTHLPPRTPTTPCQLQQQPRCDPSELTTTRGRSGPTAAPTVR